MPSIPKLVPSAQLASLPTYAESETRSRGGEVFCSISDIASRHPSPSLRSSFFNPWPSAKPAARSSHPTKNKNAFYCSLPTPVDAPAESLHDQSREEGKNRRAEIFACPVCYKSLIRTGPSGLSKTAISRSRFECQSCKKKYYYQGEYIDLTLLSNQIKEYSERLPTGIELFRNPLVSFVYERGWRQNFARSGFPGVDEEFKMAQKFLEASKGGVLVDASCGSGLFSRKFAACSLYSAVIALDFSENMLQQASDFIRQDSSLSTKADIARLPFESESIDAVHAGAALHCWPSPSLAVAEISRVLKPGGVFVATTFLAPRAPIADEYFKPIRKVIRENQNYSIRYWEIDELEGLCNVCGLVDYQKDIRSNFIMLCARKPH